MSDFDFEELDKAVTGALSNDEPTPMPQPTQPDPAPVSPAPVVPVVNEILSSNDGQPISAPASRRGSGRFMDVVHPSSDMRTRSGTAISPLESSSPVRFTAPAKPVEPTPVTDDSNTVIEPTTPSVTDTDLSGDALDAAVGEWIQPLDSPFLPDAKVEKRPLGGVGPEPSQMLLDAPEEELLLEAPNEPLLEAAEFPDPIDFAVEAPTHSDHETESTDNEPGVIEAVEVETQSEPTVAIMQEPVVPSEIAPEEGKGEEPEAPKTPIIVEATPVAESEPVAQEPIEPVGPTSITQQYTEQSSTAQASGAIYDTETYHKPLKQTGKKHSGIWTVLWIFLLIVLGAGAGVAFYLFVLPML